MPSPRLIILAGPAGSGKTTLCDRLLAEIPGFERIITTTTRPPRPGEIDGVHYHFLTPEQFDDKVAANAFLEWAWVHQKNRYGTLSSSVREPLAAGRSLVLNIDVQGVDNFRRAAATDPLLARCMTTVFITLPVSELRRRLDLRGESPEEIERRMKTAEKEFQEAAKFDHIIESHSRDEDFAALCAIVEKKPENPKT